MDSQALYRKWRPQTLSEVAGQEHVTRALKNALERGRVVHAYLFCGPRGTGKTSTGRILAKAVNCLTSGHGEPCNTCTMCQAVTNGSALDVIEIDAASNRGIDEIRDLREKVNFSPAMARHKVYIIDEVHMLTEAAANALLKTLEEPPPYVIFVLATTESHKLLPTILSRCQRYDFRRLTQSAVVARLSQICASEQFQFQPEALNLIARSASGSLRDAVNLLEQMVNYYGSQVELPQVQAVMGITGDQRSRELARYIATNNTATALQTLNAVLQDGLDLRQFHRELLDYMRQLLLVKCGSAAAVDATAEDIKEMQGIVAETSLEHVVQSVKLLGKVDLRLDNYSPLPLEIAIVECGLVEELPPASPRKAHPALEAKPKPVAAVRPSAVREQYARPETAPTPTVPRPTSPALAPARAEAPASDLTPRPSAAVAGKPVSNPEWDRILQAVRGANKTVAAWLNSTELLSIESDKVVVTVRYPIYKEKIEDPEHRKLIEDCLCKALGKTCRIECVYQPKENKVQRPSGPQGHLVQAALKMGAKIISTEEQHAE